MSTYITLYILLIIFSILSWRRENEFSIKLFFLLMCLVVILIPALRDYSVGTDTKSYIDYFYQPNLGYNGNDIEFTYLAWNNFIGEIWQNGHFYIFITAFLSLSGVLFFIYKNSPYKFMSLLLFIIVGRFYFLHFSGLRQSIAISFFLIALHYYILGGNLQYVKFSIFYFISVLFHTTALAYLPIVLIVRRVNFSRSWAISLIAISFILGLFQIFNYRVLIEYTFNFLGGTYSIFDRYDHYSYAMEWAIGITRIIRDMLPLTLLGIACYWYGNYLHLKSIVVKLFVIGVMINNLIISFPMSDRLVMYLTILSSVAIPIVFNHRSKISIITYCLTVAYFFYKSYSMLFSEYKALEGNIVVYYHTFFN